MFYKCTYNLQSFHMGMSAVNLVDNRHNRLHGIPFCKHAIRRNSYDYRHSYSAIPNHNIVSWKFLGHIHMTVGWFYYMADIVQVYGKCVHTCAPHISGGDHISANTPIVCLYTVLILVLTFRTCTKYSHIEHTGDTDQGDIAEYIYVRNLVAETFRKAHHMNVVQATAVMVDLFPFHRNIHMSMASLPA